MNDREPEFVVKEFVKRWTRGDLTNSTTISQDFQKVINDQRADGYTLQSWKFAQTSRPDDVVLETIVAVFKRD